MKSIDVQHNHFLPLPKRSPLHFRAPELVAYPHIAARREGGEVYYIASA